MALRTAFALAGLIALLPAAPARGQEAGRVLSGRAVAVGAQPVAVRVIARAGGWADSTAAAADGHFSLTVPSGESPLEISAVAIGAAAAAYHAALIRLGRPEEAADSIGIVLVPRVWAIEAGRYAGVSVEVRVGAALVRECGACPLFFATAGRRGAPVFAWTAGVLPLRVAFDRAESAERISGADSVAFWRAVAAMEDDAGMDLFRPAARGDLGDDPENSVLVVADHTLSRFAAWGSVGASDGGQISTAAVAFRSFALVRGPDGPALVAHEMVHALGFGHTCAWPSLVAERRRCAALRTERLSPDDVAYLQLAAAVQRAARAAGTARPWEATLAANAETRTLAAAREVGH